MPKICDIYKLPFERVYDIQDEFTKKIVNEVMKRLNKNKINLHDGYVDHQSRLSLPFNKEGTINLEFWEEFTNYISKNKNIVIVGGNDNSCEEVNLPLHKNIRTGVLTDNCFDIIYSFKDNFTKDWILKNSTTGSVFRYNFIEENVPLTKAGFPTMVDLNITDKCNYNCSYCYKSCTPEGKHAAMYDVINIMKVLAENNVVDVVLGGGNILLYDNLSSVFSHKRSFQSISTTIKLDMNMIINNMSKIKNFDSIAITITPNEKTKKVLNAYNLLQSVIKKPVIQVVLELFDSAKKFISLMKGLKNNVRCVSIVGYKEFGRGLSYFKEKELNEKIKIFQEDRSWLDFIKDNFDVYFDSIMVKRYFDLTSVRNPPALAGG